MTIAKKIYDAQLLHKKKFKEQPELMFINNHTYEEILKAPLSAQGFPTIIANSQVIPANSMQREFVFFTHDDMDKALSLHIKGARNDISIKKLIITERKDVASLNARRIVPDRTVIHVWVPYQAIDAYRRYLKKDLKF